MERIKKMEKLKMMLKEMKNRPGVYLGSKSFSLLVPYVDGYYQAMNDLSEKKYYFWREFQEFLLENHPEIFAKSYWGWQEAIPKNTSSEAEAFDYFFELLEEFWNEKL